MSSYVKDLGNSIRKNKAVTIIIWCAALVGLVISGMLMYEDYCTSRAGYIAIPTAKVNDYTLNVVPILPSLIAFIAGWMWFTVDAKDKEDRRARSAYFMLAALCLLVDIGTDVIYKVNGDWRNVFWAFGESLFIYTIGSEMLLGLSFGLVLDLFPDMLKSVGWVISSIQKAFRELSDMLSDAFDSDEEEKPTPQRPQGQTPPQHPQGQR